MRPSSRSYHRKAGTPSALPCRSACWLAGVVHGIWTVHSCTACEPLSIQRRSVGMLPDWRTQRITGNDTPSSCTKSTPSTSGSSMWPGLMRSRLAVNDSSVPALLSQASRVPKAAAIQAAANAVQKESNAAPGTRSRARYITIACPKRVARPTATHPNAEESCTSTGRTIMPTRPVIAEAATRGSHEV